MAVTREIPAPPRLAGIVVDPNADPGDLVLSDKDRAFFQGLTDEKIDAILAAETDPDSGL